VTQADIDHAAALLVECRQSASEIPDLPDGLRPSTFDEAYAIQDALHRRGGWDIGVLKVGATGPAAREALGVDGPIAGRLALSAIVASGATVSVAASPSLLHPPRLESEFALRLGDDAPGVDVDDLESVRGAVDAVAPALELVDSRFRGPVDPRSMVADNSGSAAIVLGAAVPAATVGDLSTIAVTLSSGDEQLGGGSGADVMGDPVASLQWVLQHERDRGRAPVPGTWIITGTCTGMIPYPMGQRVVARFEGLGEVSVTVTA
jgi:2-keto-4-pentenoate hydratase